MDTPTGRTDSGAAASGAAAPIVVLVDDDRALRAALRFSLEVEGYRVVVCERGEEVLAIDLPSRAGCLVVDYRLPGLDGLSAIEQLRGRGVALPAILITSYANPMLHARAELAGVEVVEKPLVGDALLARIHALAPLATP